MTSHIQILLRLVSFATNPFGTPVTPSGTEKFKYAGEMLVGAAGSSPGLYYIGARWMDPELGRFVSLDPQLGKLSMPQSMNRYVYCVNNPLRYTDPTGWKTFVPRHQESDMNFDEFMYAIGFVPFIGDVSDAYFLIKYAYEKDWTNLGITAAGAALPFIGGSYLRSAREGAGWLGSQFARHADDVPISPAARNADELPEKFTKSFLDGKHVTLRLDQDLDAYRIFGETTKMRGSWFALVPPGSGRIAQDLYSLPGGNTAEYCVRATIPRGAVIDVGIASPLFGRAGGGVQVFVRNAEMPTFFAPWRLPG